MRYKLKIVYDPDTLRFVCDLSLCDVLLQSRFKYTF